MPWFVSRFSFFGGKCCSAFLSGSSSAFARELTVSPLAVLPPALPGRLRAMRCVAVRERRGGNGGGGPDGETEGSEGVPLHTERRGDDRVLTPGHRAGLLSGFWTTAYKGLGGVMGRADGSAARRLPLLQWRASRGGNGGDEG